MDVAFVFLYREDILRNVSAPIPFITEWHPMSLKPPYMKVLEILLTWSWLWKCVYLVSSFKAVGWDESFWAKKINHFEEMNENLPSDFTICEEKHFIKQCQNQRHFTRLHISVIFIIARVTCIVIGQLLWNVWKTKMALHYNKCHTVSINISVMQI